LILLTLWICLMAQSLLVKICWDIKRAWGSDHKTKYSCLSFYELQHIAIDCRSLWFNMQLFPVETVCKMWDSPSGVIEHSGLFEVDAVSLSEWELGDTVSHPFRNSLVLIKTISYSLPKILRYVSYMLGNQNIHV
jgi:hypothetical protein